MEQISFTVPTEGQGNPKGNLCDHTFVFFWVLCAHIYVPVKRQKLLFPSRWESVKVTPSCPTLCNPIESTVHGNLQARILEWVAIPFSRGSSQPRDPSQVSCIAGRLYQLSHQEYQKWPYIDAPATVSLLREDVFFFFFKLRMVPWSCQ